ncbi:MAG: hypothetical protein JW863_20985 [Chitinispirillaceae bacterium]|nr:hypothetical protein [Chitinispirillaceae bacterium]
MISFSLGNVLYSRSYGGPDIEGGTGIISTDDGGYIVSGYTSTADTNFGLSNGMAIKLDSTGNIEWQTTIGDSLHAEYTADIVRTIDGQIASLGTKNTQHWKDSAEFYLVKMNLSGEILWEKTYKGLGFARGYKIMEQTNGNLILAGQSGTVGASRNAISIYVIGADSTGNVLWEHKYQMDNDDYGSFLWGATYLNDNRMLLTGEARYGRAIMIDSTGAIIWMNDYGDPHIDLSMNTYTYSVNMGVQNRRGEIVLAGIGINSPLNFTNGSNDFCIFQVDSMGKADFSKVKDYVGVKKEYSKPSSESFPSLFSAMSNHENTATGSVNFYNLMGQKITPFNTSTGNASILRNNRSGMIVANMRKGGFKYSGKIVQIK